MGFVEGEVNAEQGCGRQFGGGRTNDGCGKQSFNQLAMNHNHGAGFADFMSFFGIEVGQINFKRLGDHD